MRILLIGRNMAFINSISNLSINHEVYVIESPDVLKKLKPYNNNVIKEIIEVDYMNSPNLLEKIKNIIEKVKFDGVIPGFEYAVRAAYSVANGLNLPNIGLIGSSIFTNKLLLRDFCKKNKISSPNYKKISEKEELIDFFKGRPIIFKPTNRQGSIGVKKISRKEEIDDVFEQSFTYRSEKLLSDSNFYWEYIAEDFIPGYEISVEYLVKDGKVLFINYTKQTKLEEFIEIAHEIPANINNSICEKINEEMQKIIDVAKVGTTVLHAEWKINKEQPYLIECAARIPGDFISNGISEAYGFNFRQEYINLMCNKPIDIKKDNSNVSFIQYFLPEKFGRLVKIENLNLLEFYPQNIVNWELNVALGDEIKPFQCSWDRIGYYILKAENYEGVQKIVNEINSNVKFIVKTASKQLTL
ncbi:hypothetical protein CT694_31680 (plasmid) [Bacillus wiedmannii bv. thuringiensis]|nr:hypothetical protein CT694_31680 [Bacillus wiedmannii bv. thuringiensis]